MANKAIKTGHPSELITLFMFLRNIVVTSPVDKYNKLGHNLQQESIEYAWRQPLRFPASTV